MNSDNQSRLLPFYMGAIQENERLQVERELLTDTEVLVDFLDLKRKMESALEVPQQPSTKLWMRLNEKIGPRKKMIFSLSIGAAIAASVLIFSFFAFRPKSIEQKMSFSGEVLFDSNHELSANSNVL